MKPVLSLRIASALTFLHAVLHTIGGVLSAPAPGAQLAAVAAMKANPFPIMGTTRSYWDFTLGYGLAIGLFLLMESVVFWQLGSLAKAGAQSLRPVLATFFAGYLIFAAISCQYFFAAPAITEILIALCLGVAILKSRPGASTAVR